MSVAQPPPPYDGSLDPANRMARVPLFSGLCAEALDLVGRLAADIVVPAGGHVASEGEPDDRLFVIVEGALTVAEASPSGPVTSTVTSGAVLGLTALLSAQRRTWSARAEQRSRLLVLTKDAFDDLLFLHKDVAYEVLWNAVRWLMGTVRERP